MCNLTCWSVMDLWANPEPPFDGRGTRLTNPQRPAPIPEIIQAGEAALQTGMPVFRSPHRPRWLSALDKVVVAQQR